MKKQVAAFLSVAGLAMVACGGDSSVDDLVGGGDDVDRVGDGDGDRGGDGGTSAVVRIGDESWELPNVVCVVGANAFDFIAADGIIGVTSEPTVSVNVVGDPLATESGVAEVVFFAGPLMSPDVQWRSSTTEGGAVVRTDGSRVSVTGLFDDGLTAEIEQVDGTIDGDCGEMPEVPEPVEATVPDYEVDGTVVVGGETFAFTYDPAAGGRCGLATDNGRIGSTGYLVDDPTRQVVFTYGLPEATPDGEAHLQLIVYGPEGDQLWYSAVGYIPGSSSGSVETMNQDGNTVTATGALLRSGSNPEELADFTIEATCDQTP